MKKCYCLIAVYLGFKLQTHQHSQLSLMFVIHPFSLTIHTSKVHFACGLRGLCPNGTFLKMKTMATKTAHDSVQFKQVLTAVDTTDKGSYYYS